MARPALVPLAAVLALGCSRDGAGPAAPPTSECASLRLGMPEALLLEKLGEPESKIGGDVDTYVYKKKDARLGVGGRPRKVVDILCGGSKVNQYLTERDAQDAKDAEAAETPEGKQLRDKNFRTLSRLKTAKEAWQHKNGGWDSLPSTLDPLAAQFPGGLLPELDIPQHGLNRWAKTYGAEACERQGDLRLVLAEKLSDTGQWGYVSDGPCAGHVFIDCNHMMERRRRWSDL